MKTFAEFSRRHVIAAAIILFVEINLYMQYAEIDAQFHFWLHGLFGATVGLFAVTLWRLLKPKSVKLSPLEAGFLGHIYSAMPDIIFIGFGILHMYWMDIFAIHISLHFIKAPIVTMLIVFIVTLIASTLTLEGFKKYSAAALSISALIVVGSLFVKAPVPNNLQDVREQNKSYSHLCPLVGLNLAHKDH